MDAYAKAVKIAENVYWVGARDWGIRDFHGYATDRGSTYNAFLIIDEKITLIDAVKSSFYDEMMMRIASVIDPSKIDYIVSNHAEMDHSGCLPRVIEATRPEKVFTSIMGEKALHEHFGPLDLTVVQNGTDLSLGKLTLRFIETRMLHWPDSMFSYLVEDKILFVQDAFGMHLCTEATYSDELPLSVIRYEAKKYFANILLPYAPQVLKLLETVKGMNLQVDLLAPDHGPLHRGNMISSMIDWYAEFASQKPKDKILIIYASMWESTTKMARAIGEGCARTDMKVKLLPLSGVHRSEVMTELMEAGAIILGSPTLNHQIFPTMADMLCYMKGLAPQNLIGGVFGSFGWSGESVKILTSELQSMGVEMIEEAVRIKYVPTNADLLVCADYGEKIALALKNKLNN